MHNEVRREREKSDQKGSGGRLGQGGLSSQDKERQEDRGGVKVSRERWRSH